MFGRPYIVISFYQKSLDTAFNVLTNVTSLCERVAVAYCERHVELFAQSPDTCLQ